MEITNSDNVEWQKVFLENEFVIVNYQPSTECKGCAEINELFQRLDKYEGYKNVKFLWVDSRSHPIREQFIKKTQTPFMAAFKEGFLVECRIISNESELNKMIERLFEFKIKL